MAGESRNPDSDGANGPRRKTPLENLSLYLPWNVRRRFERLSNDVATLGERADRLELRCDTLEQRSATTDQRCDSVESAVRELQEDIDTLRGQQIVALERRLDGIEATLREVGETAARTRDDVVPAVVERNNLLIDRMATELDETTSLVERMLRSEPLPVTGVGSEDHELATALKSVQPVLVEAFRGSETEIGHRLEHHLPLLRDHGPVLDLGSGRGEMLVMLRDAGVDASGVEADPALAGAASRRGLEIVEGDAISVLREQPAGRWGAITAIHMLEHLDSAAILALFAEARRVLRPGGLFVVESPNPRNLRVGASEFWVDPTHRRPLLADTLEVFFKASGFQVERLEYLHPFPAEQQLASRGDDGEPTKDLAPEVADVSRRLDRLAGRLDELLNGPRDFMIVASNPETS
jgi:O-antigen chain-terminating methyltransferase